MGHKYFPLKHEPDRDVTIVYSYLLRSIQETILTIQFKLLTMLKFIYPVDEGGA